MTMASKPDVESGSTYHQGYDNDSPDTEREALLPISRQDAEDKPPSPISPTHSSSPGFCSKRQFASVHVSVAFVAGIFACFLAQYAICGTNCFSKSPPHASTTTPVFGDTVNVMAPPYVGSTEVHNFPPTKPTNAFPSLFPTNVGYAGGTPTGAEAAVVATAPSYPIHSGAAQLVLPESLGNHNKGNKKTSKGFNLFRSWGNLSPWYTVDKGRFGVDAGPETPESCRVTGLHFLHRHGARYPTAWAAFGGPANFSRKLNQSANKWNASHDLEFMNEWTYKLGEELLTPFGRQQLFDLGISMRLKYGFLLKNFTESNTIPVFRTESQDRMLHSALNFAIGFFGYPFEGQYQQSITIEAAGFNNTLAPYKTCPNANIKSKADRGVWYVREWANIYLKDAQKRLQTRMHGLDLTVEDIYSMQQMCAYETVAIGYSKFCELFTEEEWEGFNYALDLTFWYGSAFGSPVARVQGIGYIQELVSRLTHTPIETHNSSTNATLNDNPITFPLGQSLYVDATHEVVVLNIITALNLSNFAEGGPLPYTHIPKDRTFKVAELAPFATNVQFQLLECSSIPNPQIRIIINDGVAPLTGINGCPKQKDGMCPVDTFVNAQKEIIANTDWQWDCHGDWTVPEGTEWETVTGDAPKRH
ncbi:histidine phosphatase superfamily [Crucibulum laeve]|uniref:Histidine phosphatase superfamily n=1 Tax=Crucibulum laeve TaxID=68775 RepID=A0A5C3LP92_9AGAR|nr:histidine phosphatase superfamily [Crucibulum laeve]